MDNCINNKRFNSFLPSMMSFDDHNYSIVFKLMIVLYNICLPFSLNPIICS